VVGKAKKAEVTAPESKAPEAPAADASETTEAAE
jgi:hypothetical protein